MLVYEFGAISARCEYEPVVLKVRLPILIGAVAVTVAPREFGANAWKYVGLQPRNGLKIGVRYVRFGFCAVTELPPALMIDWSNCVLMPRLLANPKKSGM